MIGRRHQTPETAKRRTTLTLPAESLMEAARIARVRKVTLSTVISEALSAGLRTHAAAERSEQVLSAYKKAFNRFSDEDMLLLDGIVTDPAGKRN